MKCKYYLSVFLFLLMSNAYTGRPPLTFAAVAGFSPTRQLAPEGRAFVKYVMTNETNNPLSFTLDDVRGIQQYTANSSYYKRGQIIPPHESRILALAVIPVLLYGKAHTGGPNVFINGSRLIAYGPSERDILSVTTASSTSSTTLSTSASTLALSVFKDGSDYLTGKARTIKITNAGANTAKSVEWLLSAPLPSGASISPDSCGDMAGGDTCVLTVTPGTVATTEAIELSIQGENTAAVTSNLNILNYMSQYQSGYVFAIDDTTAADKSVEGKVAALTNQAAARPLGVVWLSNGKTDCLGPNRRCADDTLIPGINQSSRVAKGDACDGNIDGNCNTDVIVNYSDGNGIPRSYYAAGLCRPEGGFDGFDDWYLGSICENGYYTVNPQAPTPDNKCGSADKPTLQNMLQNLDAFTTDAEGNTETLIGVYWSSTAYQSEPPDNRYDKTVAWTEYFPRDSSDYSLQTHDGRDNPTGVRCIRKITQP
ncbi:MAG: DUF11 domain-containing protein [Gammaproteobacteria bacterium]|nr:DUF11 domain-containing protein [Gammaproteobacteria bacterium]